MQLNVPAGLEGSDTALTRAHKNTKWTNCLPNCVQKKEKSIRYIPFPKKSQKCNLLTWYLSPQQI